MPMTPREMIRLLESNGFQLVDSNGSHHKYKNPATKKITVVPVHARELKRGLEQAILKQAGLK